jgi:hypothetical protein
MSKNLLKGFLGSAATLALALNMNAASAQDDAVSNFAGLNFGVGYGFEVATHGDDEKEGDDKVPGVGLKKETIFGKDAKTKVESNGTFSNLGGVAVTPESYGNGDSWKSYAEEMDEKQGGAYGEGGHSQELSFKDIQGSDEKKRRNMQHYGWLSAGWLYPISGDFFIEPQLTLKVKGTPEKRKVEDNETVYSQYLAGKIGTSAVQVTSDIKNHQATVFGEGNYGDLLVKVGTYKTPASGGTASVIEKAVTYADAAEGMYYKLGNATHEGAEISGKTVEATNLADVLKEKILGSKDASGTKLSQSIYMTRTLDFELKNNFEAALHANLGYAFNQYFAVYAKLGMSLDFYKLDYKKGAIEKGIDDYAFDNMNFKVDVGDVAIGNMYVSGKDGKAETGVLTGGANGSKELKGSKELDLFMRVSKDKRTGAKAEWDKDAKALKPAEQKDIDKMLADAKLSAEKADDDVTTSKKNTFVSLNADFGLGMMANVYKGLQLRAEFVYSLPMNKEKKMYNDNVTLTMKPHKFKFNFGVVVPLNMIMGK